MPLQPLLEDQRQKEIVVLERADVAWVLRRTLAQSTALIGRRAAAVVPGVDRGTARQERHRLRCPAIVRQRAHPNVRNILLIARRRVWDRPV